MQNYKFASRRACTFVINILISLRRPFLGRGERSRFGRDGGNASARSRSKILSRALGSRKSWTQLVKWRANVAHPSKLETSSVYLHPSWKFQNAQPNTPNGGWRFRGRREPRTSVASVTKEGTRMERWRTRRERRSYLLWVSRRKKPSSYRQSRGRWDKNRPA